MKKYHRGLVSVIITTHNRKEMLVKAIESVLGQTYKKLECIVVDDASTDGTREHITEYINNKRILYYYISENESRGGNYARNVGLENASGDVVAFLDDDDEWLSTKIEKQLFKLSEENQFVYCGRIFGTGIDFHKLYEEDIENCKYKEGNLSKEVLVHVIGVTSTIMVKHQLIDKVGKFDENLKAWQEYDLCIRLLQNTKAAIVRENLVLYRMQIDDKSRNTNNIDKWIESTQLIEKKYKELFKQLGLMDCLRRKLYKCIDGYNRAKNANNVFLKRKYWFSIVLNPAVVMIAVIKKLCPNSGL